MSKRKDILVALEQRLKTITVENGYSETIVKVSRKYRLWEDAVETPRVNLLVMPETMNTTMHRFGDERLSSRFAFRLVNYIKGSEDTDDQGLLSDKAESHIADVKKCLYGDATLGFDYVDEFGLDLIDAYFAWSEHKCILRFEGHYNFEFDSLEP